MANQTEFRTIVLKPYGASDKDYTFRVANSPPIKSGRTKVFPPHQTIGPTDPDFSDTLHNLNFMDISGGLGVYTISPASDLNSYWWGIAEAEGTDGWTMAREPIMTQHTGTHVPLGRIGASTYGLWGTDIYIWVPATQTWTDTTLNISATIANTEGIAYFNEQMFIPLGSTGYDILFESAPGTLAAVTAVAGAASPAYVSAATPTTNPRPLAFAVWRETIYALTTKADGHYLVPSMTGATGTWQWASVADTSRGRYAKMDTSFEPHAMTAFPNAQNQMSLWASGRRGLKTYNDSNWTWEDTNFSDVPPHPDMGRAMKTFRPGEALWIAGGGGDAIQYTVGGAVVPASGPGGAKQGLGGTRQGLPGGKRGSIVSWASDLFHLYALVQGETAEGASASIVEDTEGGDPIYVPGAVATSTVIGYNGKGWHPVWESVEPGGVPSKIVVSDAVTATGGTDYRAFWGIGEQSWSVQCRLTTHSSRQAIQTTTGERFRSTLSMAGYTESYLEWGRWNAGSIATHKLASHAALLMESATTTEYAEYLWQDEHSGDTEWNNLGAAMKDSEDDEPRIVLPFGGVDAAGNATTDPDVMVFSKGEPFQWIRQRVRMVSSNPLKPPIITAMSLSYMPVPQDAGTKSYSVYLSPDVDEITEDTAEKVINKLEALFSPNSADDLQFYELKDGKQIFRAYISALSYGRMPTVNAPGALTLSVIQIPAGVSGLLGEVVTGG